MSRILIVEDEQHLADGLRFNLEAEQHDVDLVDNGEEALRRLTAEPNRYDLVILDVMLPGIDGFAVADQLRKLEDPPVVILTSSRDRADYGRCIGECGAHGFVPKADLSGAAIAAFFAA